MFFFHFKSSAQPLINSKNSWSAKVFFQYHKHSSIFLYLSCFQLTVFETTKQMLNTTNMDNHLSVYIRWEIFNTIQIHTLIVKRIPSRLVLFLHREVVWIWPYWIKCGMCCFTIKQTPNIVFVVWCMLYSFLFFFCIIPSGKPFGLEYEYEYDFDYKAIKLSNIKSGLVAIFILPFVFLGS